MIAFPANQRGQLIRKGRRVYPPATCKQTAPLPTLIPPAVPTILTAYHCTWIPTADGTLAMLAQSIKLHHVPFTNQWQGQSFELDQTLTITLTRVPASDNWEAEVAHNWAPYPPFIWLYPAIIPTADPLWHWPYPETLDLSGLHHAILDIIG